MTFLKYLYAMNLVINMQYRVSQKDLNNIILFNRLQIEPQNFAHWFYYTRCSFLSNYAY